MRFQYLLIGLLGVVILFLGSVVYKQHRMGVFQHFPIPGNVKNKTNDAQPQLYLFLFFSKNDCIPCLEEISEVLDSMSSQFIIIGIIPDEELKNEEELRRLTGFTFPFFNYQQFKKYLPWHSPTLLGVTPGGDVIFMFPGITSQKVFLENFLVAAFKKFSPSINNKRIPEKDSQDK